MAHQMQEVVALSLGGLLESRAKGLSVLLGDTVGSGWVSPIVALLINRIKRLLG